MGRSAVANRMNTGRSFGSSGVAASPRLATTESVIAKLWNSSAQEFCGQELLGTNRPGRLGTVGRLGRHDPDLGPRLKRRLDESRRDRADDPAQDSEAQGEPLVSPESADKARDLGRTLGIFLRGLRRPGGRSGHLSPGDRAALETQRLGNRQTSGSGLIE